MKTLLVGCGEWGFRDLPMAEHFRIAGELGFRTMEIGIGGDRLGRLSPTMSAADITAFKRLREQSGIATPFCCLENDFTQGDPNVAGILDQIRLAKELDATHVRLFAGFTPVARMTEMVWRGMLEAFMVCHERCCDLQLVIAIETHGRITLRNGAAHHQHTVSTDPASLRRLLWELPPNIGFNFDPGNLKAVAPADRNFCLDLINDRINYCHLKDWRRLGDGWEAVAMGDDDLDYGALLPRLQFAGPYLIEYEPTVDVTAGIRRSLDYLRRLGYELRFR